ncbi:hypothetical protein A1O1_01623 [Capronia coronata CBS 617.96]|uniref:Uncharacterized protein n=1 Tax=Capronia coronata CBS 617.96 TaxID=1182541 RepID=W9YUB6_9EURO|nr:uncharacterized protein A1O1_01623 [Capronia coronata CBS 617.96]EXJ96497.1 hypothetical protein A1O1_01623 [Capronia coronata CBS 617.96]
MIDRLIASSTQLRISHHLCDDLSENLHIFPDICEPCKRNGVIASWIDQQPGGKFEVLRAWKEEHRQPSNIDALDETDSAERLSVVSFSDSADSSTAESASPPTSSSDRNMAIGVTSDEMEKSDLTILKARVAGLTTRTDRLLARIRARKAMVSSPSPDK